ncbi:MAG TPA: hypothetical protein VN278_07935, partial [Methanosarcina sp.]|nr:hypothetical protein [Methanosarcina sp.]
TPDSNLTIYLPPGFDAKTAEGLDGKKLEFENNLTILKGNFDHGGNVTLWLLENESFKANLQDIKENNETGSKFKEAANKTLKAQGANKSRENSAFLKKFLAFFT